MSGILNPDQLTFWWEELPAKHFLSQDSEKDSPIREETSRSRSLEWLTTTAPNGLSGKTSPVSCRPTEDGTLVPSSGRWANSGMGGPTESWTLNTTEWPSGGAVSSLSDTLQAIQDVAPRYYLSQRACAGILRRAEKRGKKLPPILEQALQAVVAGGTEDR